MPKKDPTMSDGFKTAAMHFGIGAVTALFGGARGRSVFMSGLSGALGGYALPKLASHLAPAFGDSVVDYVKKDSEYRTGKDILGYTGAAAASIMYRRSLPKEIADANAKMTYIPPPNFDQAVVQAKQLVHREFEQEGLYSLASGNRRGHEIDYRLKSIYNHEDDSIFRRRRILKVKKRTPKKTDEALRERR